MSEMVSMPLTRPVDEARSGFRGVRLAAAVSRVAIPRLVIATALFYGVAVLYEGTVGYTGGDVFVEPLIPTAVFAAAIVLPVALGWLVSWRLATTAREVEPVS